MISRRQAVIALGAGPLLFPFGVLAQQQGKVWRIGFLASSVPPARILEAFRDGLRERGYVEGKNVAVEYRWPSDVNRRLSDLAAELVRLNVDLIFAWATPSTLAAKRATTRIPIVMVGVADPVGSGLVASLARPGGNVTGVSNLSRDLSGRAVELLVQIVPQISRFAALRNVTNPSSALQLNETEAAARQLGLQMQLVDIRTAAESESAFVKMSKARAAGVVMLPDPIFLSQREQIAELALKHRLPTIFGRRENTVAGGLMAYGPKFSDEIRQAVGYVDRIFKGAKPADLPVEQPTKFELVINGKTVKALGLKIPQSLLISADTVIE